MDGWTKAAILQELGEPLKFVDLRLPVLRSGQVLVDVEYSGICHTQLLEISGSRGPDRFLPHALGHEGSGIVKSVGPEVSKVKPGDHVVMSWIKGIGYDVPSTVYQGNDGPVNSGAISTFMCQTVISENRVTRISEEMPLKEAALLGCAVLTGAGTVLNTTKLGPGDSMAVFGVGGIGLSAVMGGTLVSATEIIAIDLFDHKLKQAKDLGATHLINSNLTDPLEAILEITNGIGVDFAIEAAGKHQTMETALKSVRDNGGLCVLAGNLPFGQLINVDPMDLIKGKRVLGTWGGETRPDHDIPMYERLFASGHLPIDKLITGTYQLDQINEALHELRAGNIGRALIDLNSDRTGDERFA